MAINKKIIAITAVLLIALGALIAKDIFFHGKKNSDLMIKEDQPVFNVYGKIDKLSDNSFMLNSKGENFTVLITKKTSVSAYPLALPYLFITPTIQPHALSFDDLTVNDIISAESSIDLRTLQEKKFEAVSIISLPPINRIFGTVKKIDNNSVVIVGLPARIAPFPYEETFIEGEYTIKITPSTEISYYTPPPDLNTPGTAQRLTIENIKLGDKVTIFTDKTIPDSRSELSALLIQPFITNLQAK